LGFENDAVDGVVGDLRLQARGTIGQPYPSRSAAVDGQTAVDRLADGVVRSAADLPYGALPVPGEPETRLAPDEALFDLLVSRSTPTTSLRQHTEHHARSRLGRQRIECRGNSAWNSRVTVAITVGLRGARQRLSRDRPTVTSGCVPGRRGDLCGPAAAGERSAQIPVLEIGP
jgi:hypothetical protein